jgi:dTDP-4-amino-4,6-dideoxygalactose transaminase
MKFRDLWKQYLELKSEIDAGIQRVIDSSAFILGEPVAELENKLAEYVGKKHCVSCGNGTDALQLALMIWGIGPGDAVFTSDFTYFASAGTSSILGATPVFVDIDLATFNLDPDDLESQIRRVLEEGKLVPKAIVPVDLFGQPADYDRILPIAEKYALKVLEDGAQGFGGKIRGRNACSFGDIATTSFFPAKPLGCYGDGGALFTDNDDYAALLRSLRVHGKGTDKYDNVRLGLNSRLDTLQAAVLQVKLRHFDEELEAVNRVARKYNELLQTIVKTPMVPVGYTSSWAQYTIQSDHRDELQARLMAAGIPSMVYYPRTMSRQTAFAHLGQQPCPIADRLSQTVLSLPMHPYMTDEEIEMVSSIILK